MGKLSMPSHALCEGLLRAHSVPEATIGSRHHHHQGKPNSSRCLDPARVHAAPVQSLPQPEAALSPPDILRFARGHTTNKRMWRKQPSETSSRRTRCLLVCCCCCCCSCCGCFYVFTCRKLRAHAPAKSLTTPPRSFRPIPFQATRNHDQRHPKR